MDELLTTDETSLADRLATEGGVTFAELVEAAGAAVAAAVARYRPTSVLVVAGPGNNGADARVAARILADDGVAVTTIDHSASRCEVEAFRAVESPAVVIDGLFGAGLNRNVTGGPAELIAAVNGLGLAVVAIDIPSGIDGTTGTVRGTAIDADRTVTFFRKYPGHVLIPGRLHCGTVELVRIGIPDSVLDTITPATWENSPSLWYLPNRAIGGHKYDAGHCIVVSGGRWNTGASRLAARAALRIGAGAVTIAGSPGALDVHAAHLTAVMLTPAETVEELTEVIQTRRASTVVIGPALGVDDDARALVAAALNTNATVVLDADALTNFADKPADLFAAIARRREATLLTPHGAEFTRLFGSRFDLAIDKITRTRLAAQESGAIVLHKGVDTVIAHPDGRAIVNTNAPPSLATAGSGDVLAGIIGGLLAQGMTPFEAAAAGAFEHGAAAQRAPRRLVASDLIDALASQVMGE